MMQKGSFVISLDFELLWGIFDVVDPENSATYFQTTRHTIPRILDLFHSYGIQSTWACVGMLFNENWAEWEGNIPQYIPDYPKKELNPYLFGEKIKKRGFEELLFAPDIIEQIVRTPGQELASHTYSHYYCLESGQTAESFRADLVKAQEMAGKFGKELKTLVFPRNQANPTYLSLCWEEGFRNVRTNPSQWYWSDTTSDSLIVRLARTGDAYLPFGKKSYSVEESSQEKASPLEQRASRFLRPIESNTYLRKLKLHRILQEMERAARQKEVYHLWWHPHNFGTHPTGSLLDLEKILRKYSELNLRYGFTSRNMEELGKSMY